jgi:hypothetical protein
MTREGAMGSVKTVTGNPPEERGVLGTTSE